LYNIVITQMLQQKTSLQLKHRAQQYSMQIIHDISTDLEPP
jgi:hypothetical protein